MKKINLGQKDIIHFVGIGGIGMSGLAHIMKNMGFIIQGSDQNKKLHELDLSKYSNKYIRLPNETRGILCELKSILNR